MLIVIRVFEQEVFLPLAHRNVDVRFQAASGFHQLGVYRLQQARHRQQDEVLLHGGVGAPSGDVRLGYHALFRKQLLLTGMDKSDDIVS